MQYISEKRKEIGQLMMLLDSEESLYTYSDGIVYTKEELKMMLNRKLRQINGYKRVHANLNNNSMDFKDYVLYKGLATIEYSYFLEVENRLDSYTSSKLVGTINSDNYEKVSSLIQNLNKKIALRSQAIYKIKWIEDRSFELSSVGEIDNLELDSDSLYNINCLDSIMSGKISKKELQKAHLWREIHKDETNSIYVEVGNLLRHGSSKVKIP